ncbi:MAG: glucose 1-dehydrogenase [Halobacteriota archaeon]|nr:glucose 1-dehydrogenase [Halobacteriota archaeon]
MKLKDKISIVTGAGQGIGKDISLTFAKEGSYVIVNDLDLDKATVVAEEISASGGVAVPVKADVSQSKEVCNMVAEVINKFGRIDILVNNAGIQTDTPFLELSEEEWQRIIDVNLKGTFLFTQIVAREMVRQRKGKIINISSIHQSTPRFNKAHYDASKAGIAMLTKDVALELAPYKINVNCIAPGIIATPMNKDILNSPEKMAETNSKIPWKRIGEPEEVAKVALFLASDESNYITGTTICIDGGLSLGQSCIKHAKKSL